MPSTWSFCCCVWIIGQEQGRVWVSPRTYCSCLFVSCNTERGRERGRKNGERESGFGRVADNCAELVCIVVLLLLFFFFQRWSEQRQGALDFQTPHPLYRPNKDLVICRDPICASLHSGNYRCDHLEQCDYEVESDGGSSLGVIVKDVVSFRSYSNSRVLSPCVTLG